MHRRVIIAAAIAVLITVVAAPAAAQNRGDCQGRQPEGWSVTIAGPDEPGTRLVVEGRVLAADGETPLSGVTVFVFHTDAEGYYSEGGMEESDARLCGLMLTDAEGRYRFATIKPAHYATGGPPAHVHYRVWGPELSRQGFSLNFEGDPKLGERGKDASTNPTWASIRPVETRDDGSLYVVRDLRTR